jgi:methylated-DNA-[protein]-cysteine S-methyltransferase
MKKTPFQSIQDVFDRMDPVKLQAIRKSVQGVFGGVSLQYNSPIGYIDIVQIESHISQVFFNTNPVCNAPTSTPESELLQRTKNILDKYFNGETVDFREIPVKPEIGTEFQHLVWDTIYQIPHGEVRSYKWIAEQIGRPKAVRAVGNATGSNRISVIIPCHRVIGSNGNLGGYGGGLERKQQLLTLEGYPVEVLRKPREGS